MSLPASWVDRIFEKLTVAYGHDFLRRWEGLDMAMVKADWAEELAGYGSMPYAIKYGIEHLPADKPPTAKQFRAICNTVPVATQMALPAPLEKPSPAVLERIASVGVVAGDPRAWANRLRDIELNHGGYMPNGLKMTRAAREMWRTALAAA
jgi:hypothetical protein